jgi:two-component sensor histidine kinase/CheY-like chemotaxis protein
LLSAAERQAFMADLSRQQNLMINELNHRVRNILALVKSVSQRARKEEGSLESYSKALESRIMALAAAHEIGAGSAHASVSVRHIINLELRPYDTGSRFAVSGVDFEILAEVAPIFALVIHELMTNAVKYGALSVSAGRVDVEIAASGNGASLCWLESGGPTVVEPERFGFGTTLIQQAIPHEMNGRASIEFQPGGVTARLFLPSTVLDDNQRDSNPARLQPDIREKPTSATNGYVDGGVVLLVEDNFVIASGMASELREFGFCEVEICATAQIALEWLEAMTPDAAILDVNLGQGRTSYDVALALYEKTVPLAFVTGYGDGISVPARLSDVPVLTKPVSKERLYACLERLDIGAAIRQS